MDRIVKQMSLVSKTLAKPLNEVRGKRVMFFRCIFVQHTRAQCMPLKVLNFRFRFSCIS